MRKKYFTYKSLDFIEDYFGYTGPKIEIGFWKYWWLKITGYRVSTEPIPRYPDWKGLVQKRFNFRHFRFEWGRWCYNTNYAGECLDSWWEWEDQKNE